MPGTSQRNSAAIFSCSFIFQGSKKHSRTGSVTLALHRHPLLLRPSLPQHQPAPMRLCRHQLLQSPQNQTPKPPFPLENQPKASRADPEHLPTQLCKTNLCTPNAASPDRPWNGRNRSPRYSYRPLGPQITLRSLPDSSGAVWGKPGQILWPEISPPGWQC